MILRLSSWKDYRERKLISFWLSFLTSLTFFEVYVLAIVTCCLFHRENLASPYSYSDLELNCSACVKKKHFTSVRSTTWMVPGHLRNKYVSQVRVNNI